MNKTSDWKCIIVNYIVPDFNGYSLSVMDSSLPTSLKHVISNVEYYGPVLFMAGVCNYSNTFHDFDMVSFKIANLLAQLVKQQTSTWMVVSLTLAGPALMVFK